MDSTETRPEETTTTEPVYYLWQIPMNFDEYSDVDTLAFRRTVDRPGTARQQCNAAIAAIVRRAVAEDRAERAESPTRPGELPTANEGGSGKCPACNGSGWVDTPDRIYMTRCPLCHGDKVIRETTPSPAPPPAPQPPPEPEPSSMPAFPLVKEIDFDRVVFVRDPHGTLSAFGQFERELRGYLERHPVYRDRVVYESRPCPTCSAGEDDDEGWEEDDEDEDMVAGLRPEPEPSPRNIYVAPPEPTPRDRLRVAVARTLTDEDFAEAARMLRGSFRNADLQTLTFVLDCLAGRDGGGR